MPSILAKNIGISVEDAVLNLIITGMPSIRSAWNGFKNVLSSFKPYYNWNAFNTKW